MKTTIRLFFFCVDLVALRIFSGRDSMEELPSMALAWDRVSFVNCMTALGRLC